MIRICAWCQQEGKLGAQELPGEKADEQQSHGICQNHALRLRHTYSHSLHPQPHLTSPHHSKQVSALNIPMRQLLSALY